MMKQALKQGEAFFKNTASRELLLNRGKGANSLRFSALATVDTISCWIQRGLLACIGKKNKKRTSTPNTPNVH